MFTPTPEQEAILDAVKNTSDNLLISALAGAAKTSTLVLIANALPTTAILCLAFNKRIATEMQERLPSTCQARTLNSLGHAAWSKFLNKRFLQVDQKKTFFLVKERIEKVHDPELKNELYSRMSFLISAVDQGKTAGWVPENHFPHAKPLLTDDEFFGSLEEEPSVDEMDLIIQVSLDSLKQAYEGKIDFNDQILCPTVFPASFVQYPLTMVDEAQDLSALNHVMLHKIVGRKRVIAVGDECQSIYGFRGAHEDSMQQLKTEFSMRELVLSVSFRCPSAVVEEARWRAPHMQWPEWAKRGEVRYLTVWDVSTIPDGGVILCRNNAPLFNMAIRLLKNGRYPELVGNDVGKGLMKTLKSFGKESMTQAQVFEAINEWFRVKQRKHRNPDRLRDQVECMKIFASQGRDLGEILVYTENILTRSGRIKLMTGHKSKGLEFEDVYILDQNLLGKDIQDQNLRYVMQTRAKSTLSYIRSELFEEEDDDAQ